MMNKDCEQNTADCDSADRIKNQNSGLDTGESGLPRSDVKDTSKRMVHAYTLHVRSNAETKAPPTKALANLVAGASGPANALPQVRYRKSVAGSGAFQIGNAVDIEGQLG